MVVRDPNSFNDPILLVLIHYFHRPHDVQRLLVLLKSYVCSRKRKNGNLLSPLLV